MIQSLSYNNFFQCELRSRTEEVEYYKSALQRTKEKLECEQRLSEAVKERQVYSFCILGEFSFILFFFFLERLSSFSTSSLKALVNKIAILEFAIQTPQHLMHLG